MLQFFVIVFHFIRPNPGTMYFMGNLPGRSIYYFYYRTYMSCIQQEKQKNKDFLQRKHGLKIAENFV